MTCFMTGCETQGNILTHFSKPSRHDRQSLPLSELWQSFKPLCGLEQEKRAPVLEAGRVRCFPAHSYFHGLSLSVTTGWCTLPQTAKQPGCCSALQPHRGFCVTSCGACCGTSGQREQQRGWVQHICIREDSWSAGQGQMSKHIWGPRYSLRKSTTPNPAVGHPPFTLGHRKAPQSRPASTQQHQSSWSTQNWGLKHQKSHFLKSLWGNWTVIW